MIRQVRYTLGKQDRIKRRKAIERLFNQGSTISLFPFRALYTLESAGELSEENRLAAAFSVSKRSIKKAHDRNRIRRQIKEAYRLQKHILAETLQQGAVKMQLFIMYTTSESLDYSVLHDKMCKLIHLLQQKINGQKTNG